MSQDLSFGGWLRQRRNQLGVTRDELADRVGFSPDLLRKLESGERRPSGQIAHLLADYFRIPSDERDAFVAFARTGKAANGPEFDTPHTLLAPWRRAYIHRTNLPAMLTPLLGREQELAAAHERILDPRTRLLTITGAPGIGKTRLALQVASDLAGHFEDGAYFVDLAPITDPDLVLGTVAYALGLKVEADGALEGLVLDFVRERRILLVLDNFEQVLDAAPTVVRLLQASPWLKVIVTSREALHVRGERRYPMPPLKVPQAGTRQGGDVELISEYAAVKLFVERAQAVRVDFELSEGNVAEVAEICRRLGGIPLAIELIAARTRLFSPDVLLTRLEETGKLALLTGGARDLPARHRSLRGAIAWSYDLLSKPEQALFRRLGAFVGGFTLEAGSAIYEGIDALPSGAIETIALLLDKSLLVVSDERVPGGPAGRNNGTGRANGSDGEPRFSMLETIREYALEQLRGADELGDTQRRHAAYFMYAVERAEPELKGPDQDVWLARLERELGNIRAAIEWATDNDVETAARLLFALRRFSHIRAHYRVAGPALEAALARSDGGSVLSRTRALRTASQIAVDRGDFERAISYLEEGVALAQQANDRAALDTVQGQLGFRLLEHGELDRAEKYFLADLEQSREAKDATGICWGLTALGEIARTREDYRAARAYYEEGLLLAIETGNKYNACNLLGNLAWNALAEGDFEGARAPIREGLYVARELEYKAGVAGGIACLAAIASATGRHNLAAMLSGVVTHLHEVLGAQLETTDQRIYDRFLADTRQQLSSTDWETAQAEGESWSLDEAMSYALADS